MTESDFTTQPPSSSDENNGSSQAEEKTTQKVSPTHESSNPIEHSEPTSNQSQKEELTTQEFSQKSSFNKEPPKASKSDAPLDNSKNQNKESTNYFLEVALKDLKDKRTELEREISELLERKTQIEKEVSTSFSGQSDAIARRVKGFQDYLTGALQDLAHSAEQLELVTEPVLLSPSPLDKSKELKPSENVEAISAIADTFKPDEDLIRSCLEQFLGEPDFYADPWKLRRSLEAKDVELLEDWFFGMGGRGAQPSRGNRSRNILVTSALISIMGELYGDRFQVLVLASQPERLGEWRRGLQDALGLGREDFGPNSGIVLFERPDGLIERADRLEERNEMPLIIIDAAERNVEIPILQFPIWLAFAASTQEFYLEDELI